MCRRPNQFFFKPRLKEPSSRISPSSCSSLRGKEVTWQLCNIQTVEHHLQQSRPSLRLQDLTYSSSRPSLRLQNITYSITPTTQTLEHCLAVVYYSDSITSPSSLSPQRCQISLWTPCGKCCFHHYNKLSRKTTRVPVLGDRAMVEFPSIRLMRRHLKAVYERGRIFRYK